MQEEYEIRLAKPDLQSKQQLYLQKQEIRKLV